MLSWALRSLYWRSRLSCHSYARYTDAVAGHQQEKKEEGGEGGKWALPTVQHLRWWCRSVVVEGEDERLPRVLLEGIEALLLGLLQKFHPEILHYHRRRRRQCQAQKWQVSGLVRRVRSSMPRI